ncbi:hypothetical protein CDEF62S_02057 [Castellaniella defragrans]
MAGPVDYRSFPDDLPRPQDDGGADHLTGLRMPALALRATTGGEVDLGRLAGRAVVYLYPMTGVPNVPLPAGWNEIPGARGCTPESLAFRDSHEVIRQLGAEVYGLSTQNTAYQREMVQRLGLSFPVLSDAGLCLTKALNLPTMEVAGMILLKRLTMILRDGLVEQVFYPVFPPDEAPLQALAWLREHAGR